MIRIKNLFLKYVRQYCVLYDINMEIGVGETVAFIGQAESGKTSLLRTLAKLEKRSKGEVYIRDIPLGKVNFAEDVSLGYLPSVPIFFENKTVYENLVYIEKLQVVRPAHIATAIKDVMVEFEIEPLRDELVANLTLYQKYLVSLARLALRRLDILLVDGVLDNLEGQEREKIADILKSKFIRQDNVFIITTESDEIINSLCQRKIYFENGSVVGESA